MTGADPHPDVPDFGLPDNVALDAAARLAGELAADAGRLVDFLAVRLAGALPGAVEIKHRGLLGRGPVEHVLVHAGEERYELTVGRGPAAVQTTIGQAVNGVVLKRDPVPVSDWIRRLVTRLETLAAQSSETAAALDGLI